MQVTRRFFMVVWMVLLCAALPGVLRAEDVRTTAVLKIAAPNHAEASAEALFAALREHVQRERGHTLSAQGGDITVQDAAALVGCEALDGPCLDTITELLDVDTVVFASITAPSADGLDVEMGWHIAGQGTERRETHHVESADALTVRADALATRLFVGAFALLVVRSNVLGAEVLVDGQKVGITPYTGSHPIGSHRVGVQSHDHLSPMQRDIALEENTPLELDISLVPVSALTPNTAPHPFVYAGWPILGVGLAGVLSGSITAVVASERQDTFDAIFAQDTPPDADALLEARALSQEGQQLQAASYALLYGGGALALTGATLLVLGYLSDDTDAGSPDIALSPTPGGWALTLGGRF